MIRSLLAVGVAILFGTLVLADRSKRRRSRVLGVFEVDADPTRGEEGIPGATTPKARFAYLFPTCNAALIQARSPEVAVPAVTAATGVQPA